ncbi:MAG: DUF3098 domain-containing protein [Flavobacteriia bacterium]|nr:DUF3098 domain-containing protein [Flavobacteriia bacterium]
MNNIHHFGFDTKNFRILIAGLCINVFGFILMIGGGSEDPNTFNEEALFSPIRITLAPVFILLGYIVVFFAIMKVKKNQPSAPEEMKDLKANKVTESPSGSKSKKSK